MGNSSFTSPVTPNLKISPTNSLQLISKVSLLKHNAVLDLKYPHIHTHTLFDVFFPSFTVLLVRRSDFNDSGLLRSEVRRFS